MSAESKTVYRLRDFACIPEDVRALLTRIGLRTTADLLDAYGPEGAAERAAENLGLDGAALRSYVRMAELATIRGIGPQIARALLEQLGIHGIEDLAEANADELRPRLAETLPTLSGARPAQWVASARRALPTSEDAQLEAKRCLSCRMCIGCGVCQAVCPQDAIDYLMVDESTSIVANEILVYPGLVEGRFQIEPRLKDLYNNSLNALTPMELEYILTADSAYDDLILRPSDGELPENIAFINLPEQDLITESDTQLNCLEFEYMLKLILYITNKYPNLKITLFTNIDEIAGLPDDFSHLKDNHHFSR